jgi:hypothetical protein
MGVGVIARDHEGKALAMFCVNKEGVQDPTMAEAVAVWEAVELAAPSWYSETHTGGGCPRNRSNTKERRRIWDNLWAAGE